MATRLPAALLVAALACTSCIIGCSSTRPAHRWTDEALAAENLQASGELDEAEREYARLLDEAPDEERRRWLLFNLAEVAAAKGAQEIALARYRSVYEAKTVDRFGARAMLRAADMHAAGEDSVAKETAAMLWHQVVRRFPNEVAAEDALDRIIAHHSAAGRHDALLRELDAHHAALGDSFLGDNLLLRMALHQDQVMGQPDAALATFRRLLEAHPDGPLADDALWEMAVIYRRHQLWGPSVALLERLTTDIESSWFVGSYASAWVDDALYELGRIHLLFLEDYERAVEYFERFIAEFSDSILADDAGWHIVEARRLQAAPKRHREALARFVERFPESRFAEAARARLGQGGAP